MEGEFNPKYEVRYYRAELQKMQWSGLGFGLVFALGPYILFKTGGQASSPTSTIALWIWGLLGLPLGIFLLMYSWWGFNRLRRDGLALVLNEQGLMACPMFLPELKLTWDQVKGTSYYEHQTQNEMAKSLCLQVHDQTEILDGIPVWLRWWAKSTASSIGTPISLPERLVDCPLQEIEEGIKHFSSLHEGREVITKMKEDGERVNAWYKSFKTDEEFALYFSSGPIGYWVSAAVGFTYAPMDRDVYFGADGKGWISVAFVGPELEFEWKFIGPSVIEVWAIGEGDKKTEMSMSFLDRNLLLTSPEENWGSEVGTKTDQIVGMLEFERLSYVRSTSSPSSS